MKRIREIISDQVSSCLFVYCTVVVGKLVLSYLHVLCFFSLSPL